MRLRLPRMVIGAQTQVLVDAIRINDLSRIHLPIRIPDRLELAESLDQFVAKHFVEKFSSRLAVTMLSAKAASVA